MDECCNHKTKEIAELRSKHGKTLVVVLALNASMFLVEGLSGLFSHSTSLLADSLDMLGDSLVYVFSLYVLNKPAHLQAKASLAKGLIMMAFGVGVIAEAATKFSTGVIPNAPLMTSVGLLALVVNGLCFFLLWQHRADNLNMRSTWLCSRNDVVANVAVVIAGLLTLQLKSLLPDLVVGALIATLFLRSAWSVIFESIVELKHAD